jgi:polyvinyl alcohol dehydrogenase (cytochrome)
MEDLHRSRKAHEIEKGPGSVGTWGPSGAGVWGSPTLDAKRGLLYVSDGRQLLNARHRHERLDTGAGIEDRTNRVVQTSDARRCVRRRCTAGKCPGPDYDFGSSVLIEKLPDGREVLLAGQKSGVVYALDPDRKGAILWQTRVGKGGTNGGVQWGMASDGQKVYAAVSDLVRKAPPGTVIKGGIAARSYAGRRADRSPHIDGEKVWYAAPAAVWIEAKCSPAQPAAVTAIPGVVFSGSDDGHLRAFATEDGRVLWDFDTCARLSDRERSPGKGGVAGWRGPVIVGGMLFVNSGYARNGGMPGNVLLAFAPDE